MDGGAIRAQIPHLRTLRRAAGNRIRARLVLTLSQNFGQTFHFSQSKDIFCSES